MATIAHSDTKMILHEDEEEGLRQIAETFEGDPKSPKRILNQCEKEGKKLKELRRASRKRTYKFLSIINHSAAEIASSGDWDSLASKLGATPRKGQSIEAVVLKHLIQASYPGLPVYTLARWCAVIRESWAQQCQPEDFVAWLKDLTIGRAYQAFVDRKRHQSKPNRTINGKATAKPDYDDESEVANEEDEDENENEEESENLAEAVAPPAGTTAVMLYMEPDDEKFFKGQVATERARNLRIRARLEGGLLICRSIRRAPRFA